MTTQARKIMLQGGAVAREVTRMPLPLLLPQPCGRPPPWLLALGCPCLAAG